MKLYDVYVVTTGEDADFCELCASDAAMLRIVKSLMEDAGDDWRDYYDDDHALLKEITNDLEKQNYWDFFNIMVENKIINY